MATSKKNRILDPDSTLITEQPALAIILSGLVVSFFIGFAIKSYFSPARIQQKITEAASRINPQMQVSFEQAEISLSRWGIPRVEVVVRSVKLESAQECWFSPEVLVDELRVPISIRSLIKGSSPVKGLELGNVSINLRTEQKTCSPENTKKPQVTEEASALSQTLPTTEKSLSKEKLSEQGLSYIDIDSIKLNYLPEARYYTEFANLKLRVRSHKPLKVSLDSRTRLLKNELLGDYFSNSSIHLEYNESPDPSVLAHFFGNFREGYYSLIGRASLDDGYAKIDSELKHIPLGAVLSLLQKYGSTPKELNANNLWLSLKGATEFKISEIEHAPMHFSTIAIEGDLLDLKSENINFHSLKPLTYDPIFIDIRKLNINKLFDFYGRPHPSKTMGSLGNFKGSAEIKGAEDIQLNGFVSDLEFIFSNLGNRELQVIKSMFAAVEFKNGNWNLGLSRIEPEQGRLVGGIKLKSDRYLHNVDLKIDVDELVLNPKVQALMTQGGEVGALQGYLGWKLKDSKTDNISGSLKLGPTKSAGVELRSAAMQVRFLKDEVEVLTKLDAFKISSGEGLKILNNFYPQESEVAFDKVEGKFILKSSQSLEWQQFKGTLGKNIVLQTSGGWNEESHLYGDVKKRVDKRAFELWSIEGTREVPSFIKKP